MTQLIEGQEKRALIERALQAGKAMERETTGLLHHPTLELIPFYENFCYCLALLRSLVGGNVQEAKERLNHLLAFQNEGRLPNNLHQYPYTSPYPKSSLPLKLIEKHFGQILGGDIRSQLATIAPPPSPPDEILTSRDAALAGLHLEDLTPLTPHWDPNLQIYVGPLNDERYNGGELELTLFDLMMGDSPRILRPHPVHLEGALIFTPKPDQFLEKEHPKPAPHSKGFHLLRRVWREGDHLHTLVCQDKKITRDGDVLIYPEEIPDEKQRCELSFYVNYHPSNTLLVNGEKGNVFRLGDTLQIGNQWTLKFELVGGEGDFIGRISRGNRPAQLDTDVTHAHDWKISLHTLRRSTNLMLKLALLEG